MELGTLDNWSKLRCIVDHMHRHTCGHASYTEVRTLLARNGLWSEQVQSYLDSIFRPCSDCKASSTPSPNRGISITSPNLSFNETLCMDHFFLDAITLFHTMAVAMRFSAAQVVSTTSSEEAMYAFELICISKFWPPEHITADGFFQTDALTSHLPCYEINLKPLPPRRHEKNMIEPRLVMIRLIFLRVLHSNPDFNASLCFIQAVRI